MDTKALLEQLLQSGREMAQKGQALAEEKLYIPAQGAERDAMLSGMGKGALAAGALALLLGTKGGRKLTGVGLKLGSLAALGGLAYKAYQNWQAQQPGAVEAGTPIGQLSGPSAEARSRALLKAMISAAKADGHIDDTERGRISAQMEKLGIQSEVLAAVQAELDGPADAAAVAAGADSPEAAAEIYLTSLLVIDPDSAEERAYLDALAAALKLAPELVAQLELQASSVG